MAFWDELQRSVSDAVEFTAKKTSELTGTAKLKYSVHTTEQKLDKCFAEIGRLFYESQKEGTDHASEIATLIMQVDKLSDDLAADNAELLKMKRSVVCPSCSAEIAKECIFCPVCGCRLENEENGEN